MVKKKKKIKKEIYDDEVFNNHLKQITKKKEPKSPKQYFINTLIILGLITFLQEVGFLLEFMTNIQFLKKK